MLVSSLGARCHLLVLDEGGKRGRLGGFRGKGVPVSDCVGEEHVVPVVCAAGDALELEKVASSGAGWQGLEEGAVHACETVTNLVQHGESGGAAPVLERRPLELGKHVGDAGCVPVPVEDEPCGSPCSLLTVAPRKVIYVHVIGLSGK